MPKAWTLFIPRFAFASLHAFVPSLTGAQRTDSSPASKKKRLGHCFTHETLVDVLTYLALCNNHFSTSRGSDRSPLEMLQAGNNRNRLHLCLVPKC